MATLGFFCLRCLFRRSSRAPIVISVVARWSGLSGSWLPHTAFTGNRWYFRMAIIPKMAPSLTQAGNSPRYMYVTLGDLRLFYNDGTEQTRNIISVHVHPDWNSDSISSGWVYLSSITAFPATAMLSWCTQMMHTNDFFHVHLAMTLPCWSCPLQFQSRLT